MLVSSMASFRVISGHSKLIELIQEHQKEKKKFAIQDVYKLIYQGVFGVEHILEDTETAKKYLEQEFESTNGSEDEELIENISICGEMVRINLRPYKLRNGNVKELFQALVQSAEEICGSNEQFMNLWNGFKQAVLNDELDFDKEELKQFDNKVTSENYPTMHHSPGYRKANRPAYRVLKRGIAERLLSSQNIIY